VGERGHDQRRAGTNDALLGWHQAQLAQFLAHARVRQRFDRKHHVKVFDLCDGVVQTHRRVSARDQAMARRPSH